MANVQIPQGGSRYVAEPFFTNAGGSDINWMIGGIANSSEPKGWNVSGTSSSGCTVSVPSTAPVGQNYPVEYWLPNGDLYGGNTFDVISPDKICHGPGPCCTPDCCNS